MKDITISHYGPEGRASHGYTRSVSTEHWILFEHKDGSVSLGRRDPVSEPGGAVVGKLLTLYPIQ